MKSGQEYLNEARKWLMENRKDFQIDYQFEPSGVVYVAEFLCKVDKATEDYTKN